MLHPVRRPRSGAVLYLRLFISLLLLSASVYAATDALADSAQYTEFIDISTPPVPDTVGAMPDTAGSSDDGGLFDSLSNLFQQALAFLKVEDKPLLGLLIFGIAIGIALILYKLLQSVRYRSQLETTNKRIQKLLASLYEIDTPLHLRLGQLRGGSRKQLAGVREAFDELLQHAVALDTEIRALTIPRYLGSEWLKKWQESLSNLTAYEQILSDIQQEWDHFLSIEQAMHDRFAVCKTPLQEANHRLEEALQRTGFPLTAIAGELGLLNERLAYGESLLISDPVEVGPLLEHIPQRVETLRKDLSEVLTLFDIYQRLPGDIASTQQQLDKRVNEEQLKMIDDRPFRFLAQVPAQLDIVKEHLQHGRHHKPKQLIETLLVQQTEAIAAIEHLAEVRDRNRMEISNIEMEISQFSESMLHTLHAEIDRVKPIFAEVHWGLFPDRINKLAEDRNWLVSMTEQLEQFMQPDVQQYERAAACIEACQKRIQSMHETVSQARNLQTELYHQLTNAKNLLLALEARLKQRLKLMQEKDLPRFQKLDEQFSSCRRLLTEEAQLIEVQPYDLNAATERRLKLEQMIDQFESLSDQYLTLQQTAIQKSDQFLSALRAAYNQHGTFLPNKSQFKKQLSTISVNFKQQIAAGQYSLTLGQIEEYTPLIDLMKQQHAAQEYNRKQAAQARSNSTSQ